MLQSDGLIRIKQRRYEGGSGCFDGCNYSAGCILIYKITPAFIDNVRSQLEYRLEKFKCSVKD